MGKDKEIKFVGPPMTEICEGIRALGGKLNHLGLDKAPAKSTASDGLRNRSLLEQ